MTEKDYKTMLMQPKHFANTLMKTTMNTLSKLDSYEGIACTLETCAMGLIDCSKEMKNKKLKNFN